MDLKNEFKWSVSRHKVFEECKRLYYLSYYAHWGGWESDASEFNKKCYLLTKMKNLDMWAGEIVHQVIQNVLEQIRVENEVGMQQAIDDAVLKLRTGWVQSRDKKWLADPKKNLNLFEHYYEVEVTQERADMIKNKVTTCLQNFFRSEIYDKVRQIHHRNWKPIEEFQVFNLDSFKVGIKIDFALSDDGKLYIYDWKTGNVTGEDIVQLVCYALYSMEKWGYPPEKVVIVPVYLKDKNWNQYQLESGQIIETREKIYESSQRMMSLLDDVENNAASLDKFPINEEKKSCRRCFFKEVCK